MKRWFSSITMVLITSSLCAACVAPQPIDTSLTTDAVYDKVMVAIAKVRDFQLSIQPPNQLIADSQVIDAPSRLKITIPSNQPVGERVMVDAALVNIEGQPLPNKVLILSIDGESVRRIRTDDKGRAEIYVGRNLKPGTYEVEVVSEATVAYASSTATGELVINPAVLAIQTVPPLPDISFILDDQIRNTDENGLVQFEVSSMGTYSLDLAPLPESGDDAPMLIQFERWADGVFFPNREIELKGDKQLFVGFSLSHRVGVSFVDLTGRAVDPARVSSYTLKSSHGTRFTYTDSQPRWLKANRVARLSNGLEATEIQYAVENVIIDGTNVVNQNQQRFVVQHDDTWPVELLLYSAHIRARDAVFGFPIGTAIELHYPEGHVQTFELDENGEVFIDSLARGDYKMRTIGVAGVAPVTPVSLSRDQDVELKVLSRFDISIGLGLGILIALGLLFFGRPQMIVTPVAALAGLAGRMTPEPRTQGQQSSAIRDRVGATEALRATEHES